MRRGREDGSVNDTIAAIATPPGRGAIAIVRVSGAGAREIADRVFVSREALRPRLATTGEVVDAGGKRLDQGLALFFPGPRSYTGEDVLELHVHGSPAVARDVLIATFAAGARLAQPGEFTRRAYLAGKLDLSAAEAVADLIASEHSSAVRAAAARLSGGLAREVETLRGLLDGVLEELAAAIDFPDEVDDPPRARVAECLALVRARIESLAQSWERGRIVRDAPSVAIVGPPNAGKSSLLNALLGQERALVSELAGTTRDTIEELLALDGLALRLIDTAGIRAHADRLERAGIERTESALAQARVALVVIDGSIPLGDEARRLLARTRTQARVVFFNKRDAGRAGFEAREATEAEALFGSAFDAASVDALRTALGAAFAGDERVDLERPHLGSARQAGAVLEADRALAAAQETLESDAPLDLLAGDVAAAIAALGELTGRDASEALLDAIFARFCIGK